MKNNNIDSFFRNKVIMCFELIADWFSLRGREKEEEKEKLFLLLCIIIVIIIVIILTAEKQIIKKVLWKNLHDNEYLQYVLHSRPL